MGSTALRVGIAGLGRLGKRHATMLARQVPGAELVAACSPVAEETGWARDALGVPHAYADYDALLAHPGLDAVFLVTPTSLHADQIVAALRAGKHVFSEKPTALDLEACRRVEAEAARHPRLKAMIGFVRRFDPHYRDAYAKIQSGAIGRPFFARSQCADMNDPSGFFVRYAPQSGGIMLDMSVHDIDAARWMLGAGRATRVYASGTIALHDGLAAANDFDNAVAIVEFEGGSIATIYASRTYAHGHESMTEVIGTAGRLSIGANPRLTRVEIADAHGVRNECTPTFYERFEEAFLRELAEFVDVVRADRAPPLTLADATEATRIGIALMESMRSRRPVDL
ncbi:MAG TPA: Gfo/Idh/MocA family oxidoreductase [Casimicrobiaceae bacterium]|jgi:myo-inositol 2-dehydrogenase/D-chiro-inositol 1-dehydrogenase|nr:Gfo/Idh/MocA family oxidoreductase [Casimicrobiaceae bacterium]